VPFTLHLYSRRRSHILVVKPRHRGMKLQPRTEMRFLAIALLSLAITLFGSLVWTIPRYRVFSEEKWNRFASNEQIYRDFLEAYRALLLGVLPALGVVNVAGAWIILKHINNVSNEPNTA